VRVTRRGAAIVVSRRTARRARRAYFLVEARTRRDRRVRDHRALGYENGAGRRRFKVRLRPARPGAIRWVRVMAGSLDAARRPPSVFVPVSGGRSSA
jgi:hypothetical protein